MIKTLKAVALVVVAAALVAAGAYFGPRFISDKTTVDSATLGTEVRDIAEFAGLEYKYTNMDRFENHKQTFGWQVPLTSKNFLCTWTGVIKLGVEGNAIDVAVHGDKVRIKLPQVKVLSHEIEDGSVQYFEERSTIFNRLSLNDTESFKGELKQKMEGNAVTADNTRRAEEQIKRQIEALVLATPEAKEKYTVEWADGSAPAAEMPQS